MEKKGGCCLAPRYGGQAWEMGRIMMKFRPIAPKPAAMAMAPPVAAATVAAAGTAKGKRKAAAAAGGGGRRGRKHKKVAAVTGAPAVEEREKEKSLSPSSSSSGMTSVDSSAPPLPPATLPLMPPAMVEQEKVAEADLAPAHGAGQVAAAQTLRPASTWVTVEAVTSTWPDGEAPLAAACGGVNDDEAPSFVSDQWGRITWTNAAFNRTASGGGGDDEDDDGASSPDAVVALAAKDDVAVPAWGTCVGFTCRVRVRHTCPRRGSLVVPCDVWRLDGGGHLWRLDLQAALSLSISGLL